MTDFRGFQFNGPRLGDLDLPRIGHEIGVGEDVIHALLDVETAGKSTDAQGRIKMLFEPHVFFRNLLPGPKLTKAIKDGLAYRTWGEKPYPKDSYPRLTKAMLIDETAALKACSWGGPQILGENYVAAGYGSVQGMVLAMLESEAEQLEAMIRFIGKSRLDDELRVLEAKLKKGAKITADDCRAFVRGYNGPRYAENDYHTKFAKALNKWAAIPDTPWTPSAEPVGIKPGKNLYDGKVYTEVLRVQERLDELGYPEVGAFDGRWGNKTRAAVLAFRADNGLPLVPEIDNGLLAALLTAEPRPVAPARKNATVSDLRELGAEDVKAADTTQIAGGIAVVGGAVTAAEKTGLLDYLSDFTGVAAALEPFKEVIVDNFWILMLGVGGVVVWKTGVLKDIRLFKHRTGQDVSE